MAENIELQQEYTGDLIHIIVQVPEDTVSCSITVKRLVNGKLEEAAMEMTAQDFRQARQDFLENVDGGDDYDAVYELTEEGRKYVEKMMGVEHGD